MGSCTMLDVRSINVDVLEIDIEKLVYNEKFRRAEAS